jgi:hypothetical protein
MFDEKPDVSKWIRTTIALILVLWVMAVSLPFAVLGGVVLAWILAGVYAEWRRSRGSTAIGGAE